MDTPLTFLFRGPAGTDGIVATIGVGSLLTQRRLVTVGAVGALDGFVAGSIRSAVDGCTEYSFWIRNSVDNAVPPLSSEALAIAFRRFLFNLRA